MLEKRSRWIAFFSVIAAIIVIVSVLYYETPQQRNAPCPLQPNVTIHNGTLNHTWNGAFVFSISVLGNLSTVLTISEPGYPESTVNLSIRGFGISNCIIDFFVNVSGHLATNLPISSFVLNQTLSGPPQAMNRFMLGDMAGNPQNFIPQYKWFNSTPNWGKTIRFFPATVGTNEFYFGLSLYSNLTNDTIPESNNSSLYNFSSFECSIIYVTNWESNTSWQYNYNFPLSMIGLTKQVSSQIDLRLVDG